MEDLIDIELFSCAGGMAEGFRRAGISFRFAFDFARNHCDSYEKNLGYRPICMDVRDLLDLVAGGWRPPPIRLLVADRPATTIQSDPRIAPPPDIMMKIGMEVCSVFRTPSC